MFLQMNNTDLLKHIIGLFVLTFFMVSCGDEAPTSNSTTTTEANTAKTTSIKDGTYYFREDGKEDD